MPISIDSMLGGIGNQFSSVLGNILDGPFLTAVIIVLIIILIAILNKGGSHFKSFVYGFITTWFVLLVHDNIILSKQNPNNLDIFGSDGDVVLQPETQPSEVLDNNDQLQEIFDVNT
jgi:hypothetical protein